MSYKTLTVGKLKALLNLYNDDARVVIYDYDPEEDLTYVQGIDSVSADGKNVELGVVTIEIQEDEFDDDGPIERHVNGL